MQDCHSCDPGSIPGAGATISKVDCHSSADSAPDFDSVLTWRRTCNIDAGSTPGTLDNVAHEPSNHLMFMNSALVFVR